MEAIVFLPVIAVVILVMVLGAKHAGGQGRSIFSEWQAAAAELGINCTRPKSGARRLQGLIGGVPVHADLKNERQGKTYVLRSTLRVGWGGRIPKSLVVHSDSLLRSMARLVGGEDEEIGDPDFDQQVELSTMNAWACAALSYGARQQLSRLIELGGEVQQGMLLFEQMPAPDQDRAWLVKMLRWLAHVAGLLSVTPDSLHQRLADNALKDPTPGVRLQNLRFLADPNTGTPPELLVSVGRSLLADVHPRVRLLAGQLTGMAGHRTLEALAANSKLEVGLRILAVNALGAGPAPAPAALSALLTEVHPPELVCAALAVAGQQAMAPLADAVLACTRSARETVRAAAAHTLGVLAPPQAEPLLIGLLSDASVEVQQASAEALGLIGSVSAVEPLFPLTEGLSRPQLRRAARGAIGRIQSRLGNVEAGRLSLAQDHGLAGAVDLADPAAVRVGELSLAEQVASEPDGADANQQGLSVDSRK